MKPKMSTYNLLSAGVYFTYTVWEVSWEYSNQSFCFLENTCRMCIACFEGCIAAVCSKLLPSPYCHVKNLQFCRYISYFAIESKVSPCLFVWLDTFLGGRRLPFLREGEFESHSTSLLRLVLETPYRTVVWGVMKYSVPKSHFRTKIIGFSY